MPKFEFAGGFACLAIGVFAIGSGHLEPWSLFLLLLGFGLVLIATGVEILLKIGIISVLASLIPLAVGLLAAFAK
ncbi:hypothetical protein [Dehalogenimonas sp. 4OHTPN]|uniref:Uncharacterized protein n=1 Tax=Dehalogenimonas sp. 4OHTPN TaxID=3166643 RepID=A0AAU8G7L6_9CHLR